MYKFRDKFKGNEIISVEENIRTKYQFFYLKNVYMIAHSTNEQVAKY